jgi:hypothetical protein
VSTVFNEGDVGGAFTQQSNIKQANLLRNTIVVDTGGNIDAIAGAIVELIANEEVYLENSALSNTKCRRQRGAHANRDPHANQHPRKQHQNRQSGRLQGRDGHRRGDR